MPQPSLQLSRLPEDMELMNKMDRSTSSSGLPDQVVGAVQSSRCCSGCTGSCQACPGIHGWQAGELHLLIDAPGTS